MPININKGGKAEKAKNLAIRIYETQDNKIFKWSNIKDLNITKPDILLLKKYKWIVSEPYKETTLYQLTPNAVNIIKNYFKSDETKTCTKCGETKTITEFNFNQSCKGGLSTICRDCLKTIY